MSRPVVIAFLALTIGVFVADYCLYDATWLSMASPRTAWTLMAPWCSGLLFIVLATLVYRNEVHVSIFRRHSWFPLLTFLFFFSLGFGRYAITAERQHRAWAVVGRPVPRGNPDEFDFMRWRWVQGRQPKADSRENVSPLRRRLLSQLKSVGLDAPTLAVAAAMTLGDRSLLDRSTRDLFSDAGAAHLLALSGLHLGIIVGLFLQLMNGRLLLSRWRGVVGALVLLFIWGYVVVAACPTSLVRAALMTSVFVIASLLNRYGDPLQHLLLTGILMLLWHPMYLFDVGAQLSFLSVAGILLIYHPLYLWCFRRWRYQLFWLERYRLQAPLEMMGVSLSAQVLTLPLVAYYFHQIPVYGALLSVVLIPLTMLFIYGVLLLLALSLVWPAAAAMLSGGLSGIVAVMMWLMSLVTSWPGAILHDFWSRKAEPQVVVYHNRACPALHLIASPAQSWLLMPETEKADSGLYYIRRDFWRRRLTADPVVLQGQRGVVVNGFKVVMANRNAVGAGARKEMMDILWVVRGFKGARLKEWAEACTPRLLVLDASLPRWQRQALAQEAHHIGWKVYDVAAQGALQLRLEEQDSHQCTKEEDADRVDLVGLAGNKGEDENGDTDPELPG